MCVQEDEEVRGEVALKHHLQTGRPEFELASSAQLFTSNGQISIRFVFMSSMIHLNFERR